MQTESHDQYYLARKDKYLKQIDRLFRSARKILPTRIDASQVDKIITDVKEEFGKVLANLPYIGGDKNINNFVYIASAVGLASFRVLENRGLVVDEIGRILYDTYTDVYRSLPGFVKALLRQQEFSGSSRKKLKAAARESQRRQYPADWVMEYVEGDGVDFDFGVNYIECATLKLFKSMGAEKYMPYMCVGDFAISKALGTGLTRTCTRFFGGKFCDFRFKRGRDALKGLSFEELPEYKNRQTPAAGEPSEL